MTKADQIGVIEQGQGTSQGQGQGARYGARYGAATIGRGYHCGTPGPGRQGASQGATTAWAPLPSQHATIITTKEAA